MWFLYLVLTAPDDLARSTGAVEDPVEEADSEDDDSVAEGDADELVADVVAGDLREHRQQQDGSAAIGEEQDGDDDDGGEGGVGGALEEGVEVVDGLLCRDDIAPPARAR